MKATTFVLLVFITAFIAPGLARAGDVQFEVGGGYAYFAGPDQKSLAPNNGYLLRFGAEAGRKSIIKWMSALTMMESAGTSNFNDNGTTRNLSYQFIAGSFDLGAKLAFLAANDRLPVQPYIGGAGSAVAASFKFPVGSTVSSTFPLTEAQNYYGYSIFVGVDVEVGRDWGFNIEVDQTKMSGTVAQEPYNLDSNRVFLQLFFRR